jgi:hypothetical protein
MIAEFDIKIRITDQDEIKPEKNVWHPSSEPPEDHVFVYGLNANGDMLPNYFYSSELKKWFHASEQGSTKAVYGDEITHWMYAPDMPK